jgi:hypothetical protein
VQFGKRSGASVRRLLRVAPHEESQALSTYLSAAVILANCGETWTTGYLDLLAHRLQAKAIRASVGCGWGVDFPYTTRFGSSPGQVPNMYQTVLAARALLDLDKLEPASGARQFAQGACQFITGHLGSFRYAGHSWLRYAPGADDPVINLQAAAAGLFARAGARLGDAALLEFADHSLQTVLGTQRSDGSWPYSADGRASFVDGIHTGFVLEGLTEYANWRETVLSGPAREAVRAGFGYFKRHLVSADAQARDYTDRGTTLDGQTVAQCIQTLVVCAESPTDVELAARVWQRVNARYGPRARIRGRRSGGSSYPALRWTIAPAALATAHLLRAMRADQMAY